VPLDHHAHPGWVAISCDRALLARLNGHRMADESIHDVVHRMVVLGLLSEDDAPTTERTEQ